MLYFMVSVSFNINTLIPCFHFMFLIIYLLYFGIQIGEQKLLNIENTEQYTVLILVLEINSLLNHVSFKREGIIGYKYFF